MLTTLLSKKLIEDRESLHLLSVDLIQKVLHDYHSHYDSSMLEDDASVIVPRIPVWVPNNQGLFAPKCHVSPNCWIRRMVMR